MVAIVSGNGLGLLGSSAGVLGSGGQTGAAGLGQAGEGAWINAKTGNLLLQRQDELLAGRGPDIGVVRTYNSQGGFDFDNGDSWQLSLYRKLASLTGTVNTAGSTIKRFEADGSQLTYTYDATLGKYVNRDGSGAYDTLSYDATGNTWTWRDGDSGLAETFEASPTAGEWRIKNVADRDGNTLTYGYDTTSGLITSVQTANGETTLLQYNASRQLTRIDIVTAGNVTTTRVRYEYESTAPSARLLKVVTDLTPQDGSVADNNTFVTTYTYHGTTTRVASITHGDGTQLSFTYDGSGRVQTYTDGSGAVTTLTYNSGNTTVTDALGQVTTLYYDSTGNLTRLQGPAGSGQDVSYTYNARGDVTQVTDSRGNVTVYGYDSQGNRIREQDAAGTVIERDYNASNQLVRQTVYAVADPDGVAGAQQAAQAQSTHYLYDDEQHLRFVVSPEGRVTEYKYDGFGQQSAVIQHAGTIDLAGLATLNYSQDFNAGTAGLSALPAAIVRTNNALTITSTQQGTQAQPAPDTWHTIAGSSVPLGASWRFELSMPATFSTNLIVAGIDSGSWNTTAYRRHRLVVTRASTGEGLAVANFYEGNSTTGRSITMGTLKPDGTYVVEVVTGANGESTLYVYEKGLSREQGYIDRRQFKDWTNAYFVAQTVSGMNAAGGTTSPGSTNTIVLDNLSVTTQAGLSALETWSASQDQRGSQRTDYIYDARGLLRQSTGYTLITAEGLGTIASQTYYVRDAAGRVLQSIDAWGMNALSSSSNADLLYQQDSAGRLTGVVFDKVTGLVKDVSARDTVVNHLTTYVHDGLGRLIYAAQPSGLGQAGYAEQTLYDGANRRVTVVQSDGLRRVSAYDQRGLLVSQQEQNSAQTVLSGASYQYDAAGRLRAATDAVGGKTYYLYDSAGRQTGRIDAAGSLTEFIYNNAGQVIRTQRYANAVTASLTTLFAPNASQVIANVGLSSVRPAANASADPITRTIFDEAGRERFRIDERGFVVESRYDGAGRLIQTLAYARALNNVAGLNSLGREPSVSDIALLDAAPATSQIGIHRDAGNDRITRRLYDADGLLRGELDAVGYLTEYRYDARGQMVQRIRHAGPTDAGLRAQGTLTELLASSAVLASAGSNLTERWIYDSLGQVTGQIDAEGYYTRHQYDANGNRIQSQRYATRADAGRLNNVVSPVTIRLRLSGTTQGGAYPQVQVKVDGVVVGTITLDSTAPKDYTLAVSGFIPGRDHNVSLVYLNDTGLVGSEDRNLFLHSYNLTTPVIVQNASWAGVQLPGNTDLTIAVWAAADGLLPYGGEVQTTRYGYTVRNQLAWQQAADGTVSRIGYDAAGRVVSSSTGWTLSGSSFVATDVRGQQQRYDLQGRLTGELNALGVVALAALGSTPTQAQIDAVWAAYGTRHEYDAAGRRTRTTDANGNQTLFFYDAMGRITYAVRRVKNPDPAHASEWVGEASKREYNALGQLTRERQMATFISATRLATLTGGAQSQITAGGAPTETTDDRVLDYTYYLTGQIKDTITYLDATTAQTTTVTQHYNAFGQLYALYTPQVSGRTHLQEFYYDRRGLLTLHKQDVQWSNSQGTVGSGTATAYQVFQEWNPFGDLARRTDSRGLVERYGYDKLGRQIAVRTDPDDATGAPELNRLRQMAFDAFDRVIKQTDALGKETLYSYDTANRTVTVTTPEGIVTKTTHNRHGEAITLVDGLGNETRFGYDKNGNLVSEKRWDKTANVETTVATHGYDTAGLLKLSTTDANGNVVDYTYDAVGRVLTRKVDPSGLNLTTTYQYDAKGQAVKVTDANGNVTQTTFDRSGRVIEVAVDPASLNLRTRYEYDLDGHVLTLTEGYGTPEARRTTYEYDNLGRRIKQVVDPDAAGYTGLKLTTTWTYDGNDNVVARIDGVGTPEVRTTRYTYDALDRLTDTIDALGGVTRNEYDLEGRVVRTTAYAQAINMATFGAPATYTLPLVTALLNQTDPNNRVSRSAYDRDGRLRFVIDALGAVTERQYDAAGNLSTQVRYANALAGTLAANTLPQVVSSAASSGAWIVTSTADRTSTYTYDAFNRLVEKRDGVGAKDPNNAAVSIETTESWAYDKVGNVIRHTDVRGQREWFAYDRANRISRHIDQGGYVTVTSYTSNQYSMTRYTDSVGVSATDDTWAQTGQAPTPTQSLYITAVTMDRANRKMREITISFVPGITPTLSAYIYDALGRLRHEARPGNSQTISRSYDAGDRLISETFAEGTSAATTTQYGYDALGNQIRIIDARGVALAESDGEWARTERRRLGYVDAQGNGRLAANLTETDRVALRALYTTTQQFDTTGRKLAVTDALGATTRTDYNALGDIVTITDALGKIGYFYTDALGRVTLQVGPDGAVTRTTFDLLGNQTATRQYANRLVNQGAVTTAVRPQIVTSASGVTGPYVLESTADAQQIAVFDALGRTSTIQTWYGGASAEHYIETFTYDAAGNVLSATARNGAVTTYEYDALGRKTREVLPVTSKNASGVATAVENRYAYDSEGHLAQKIEAYGLPEQRTTTYEYDGLGRQIRQTGDALTVFDPVAQTSSVVTPTATRSYDLAGNLLEEIDAAGARTLHFYDAANREVGRVDALGYYTAWTYDPAGNKVGETRYANAVSTSGGAALGTGSAIQVLTEAPAAGTNAVYVLANADQDRAITYRYDSQGRQIETRIANLEYGLYTQGSYQARIDDAVTRTEYDALGNVIRQTDANGNVTRSYYNAAGQKVGQLDAAGYLTVWTFDAQGRTTKQTRYANQVANWASSSDAQRNLLTLAGMSGALANATQDRVTDYTHDALGRVLTETAKGVNAGTLDANGVLQAGTVADALTTYTYNGLDKVTSRTDATNARTDWTYDGIGRVTRIEKPQFTDFEGTLNVRPTTDTEYNGLNNVVREIERGKNNAVETDDRITQYVYGAGGYLSSEIDPTGAVTEYAIDVMGRFTREVLRNRQNAAGTVSTDDVTRYRYDLMGRQTQTIDGGTYNSVVRGTGYINESGYNAFGEVTGRSSYVGTPPTKWQEFAKYDKAGRVWMTNSGDGVTKVHVHDANGNTTLTFTGPNITANLSRTESLQQTGSYSINVYDERNFFVGTRHPTTKSIEDMVTVIPADQSPGAAVVTKDQSTTIEKSAAQSTSQSLFSGDVEASRLIISETRVSSVVNGDANLKNMAISGQFNGSVINSRYGAGKIEIQTNWVYNYNSNLPTQRVDYFDIDSGVFSIPAFAAKFYFQSVVSVTTKFFVKTDYGRVLLYTNTQSNYSTLHPPATNNYSFTVNDRISFGNQPPDTDLLIVNYRLASSAPSGAWSSLVASQATSDDGNQIPGFLYLSKNQFLNGLYEIDYSALNSKGVVLNRQSGTLDLRLSFSPYIASGPNGTGSVGVGSTFSEAREVTQPSSQISYVKNMEIRGVFDPDYIRSRYGNGNIEVQTSWRYLNNSTQNNRTDVFSSASGQYSVAGVPVHNFIYVVNLTTKVYINTPSGKVLLYTNAQDYSQYPVVSVTNYSFLIANDIAIRAEPASASSMIFYYRMRPAGSDGAWLSAVASKVFSDTGVHIPGHFSVPRGLLQSYAYEFRAVTLDASGSILNEQYGEIDFRDPNSRIIMRPFSQQTQIGARGMITTDGRLQMLEQGAGSVAAASLVLRYRIKAATGDWIAVESATTGNALSLRRGNVLLGDLAGWFSLDVNSSAFVTGTEYEFDLESRDANGNVLTRARADFTRPATGTATISEFTGYAPTTVTFTSVRNASSMKVGYRAASSTGAYTYVTLTANPAGSGRFAWDTSLADDPRQSYPLDIETQAFDVDGVLIHKSTATVTLGKDASVANATDVPVPQVLRAAAPAGTHTFTLGYRPAGSTGAYTPITGTLYSAGGLNEVRADLPSGLDYGNYQYRLEAFSSSSASLGVSTSAFQKLPVVDAPPVLSWVLSEASAQTTQSQRYNAFGEITQSTDARGFVTDFEYNAVGQLVLKREPQTDITLANGYKYQARPETRYAYDAAGRLVAVTDANNHTNTQSWLNGADDESQIVLKRQADTGRERFEFDVFGQLRERINQLSDGIPANEQRYRTDYAYDKAGRLTLVTHEQRTDDTNNTLRAADQYAYDVAGNRIRHTNALGKIAYTDFDSLGRVTRFQSAGNTVGTYGYQWDGTIAGLGGAGGGGWVKTETDALSRTLIDKIDLYGRSRWHQDLGGRQFAYTYNNLGWLTAQTRTDQTGGQDIVFDHYANGFVKSIWDRALGTWTEYRYDDAGNKTYESYLKLKDRLDPTKGAADYHQYATIEYDALNRISKITDPKATIEYEYDAVGNRRRLFSSYHDGVTGARTTQEYWYAYDAMNRFTVTMGRLGSNNVRGTAMTGGPVIGTGTEGVALSYNAASQRVQATEANGVVQKYGYTTDGYLLTIRNGSDALTGNRVLDRAGRTTRLEALANGVLSTATETLYDDDSRVQSEKLYEGTTHKSTTSYFYFETIGQAAASAQPGGKGELARIVNAPAPGVTGTTLTWSHTYEYWDEAKQNGITVTGSNPALKHHNQYWAAGYTTLSYDVNGHVTAGSDAAGSRTFRYLTNAQGLILTSDELVGSTVNKVTRFQFIDGRPVGEITNDPERRRVDYVQELANKKADKKDYKNWKPIASADFDQNYEPIGERYPGGVAGSYTVRNGDTLQSIARAVWGDAAMWYLIADANGLTGSEALTADTVLTLPNKVTNIHNNSTTFRPYNPAEAMGDVTPTLPDAPPPPRKKKKCGGLGGIIVAVVTIAVAVYAPQMIPALKGLGPVLGPMVSAAVGNVAGQVVGNAIGVQSGFNFRGLATDVLSAGITRGLIVNTPVGELVGASVMGQAVLSSVVRQGVANVTGEQRGFSWAAVAGSAIGAQIGSEIGGALAGNLRTGDTLSTAADLFSRGVQGVVTGVASQLTRIAIEGGKLNWSAVAADGLGAVAAAVGREQPTSAQTLAGKSDDEILQWIANQKPRIDPSLGVKVASNVELPTVHIEAPRLSPDDLSPEERAQLAAEDISYYAAGERVMRMQTDAAAEARAATPLDWRPTKDNAAHLNITRSTRSIYIPNGSVRGIGAGEWNLKYNPVVQGVRSIANILPDTFRGAQEIGSGIWDATGTAVYAAFNGVTGSTLEYKPTGSIARSIQQNGLLPTVGAGINGMLTNLPGVGLVNGLYRGSPEGIGLGIIGALPLVGGIRAVEGVVPNRVAGSADYFPTGAGTSKLDVAAERAYQDIRGVKMTDVQAVAENSGLSVQDVTTLKKHLFFGRHEYPINGDTIVRARFVADHEIAYAWQTAAESPLTQGQTSWFNQLAQHELAERGFMAQGVPYLQREAWNGSYFGTTPPGAHNLAPLPPRTTFPGYEIPSYLLDW